MKVGISLYVGSQIEQLHDLCHTGSRRPSGQAGVYRAQEPLYSSDGENGSALVLIKARSSGRPKAFSESVYLAAKAPYAEV